MGYRKTVTDKKLVANRRNAKRSTGPRTERGKSVSKFNAQKAGLFAKHVVNTVFDGAKAKAEFSRLLADLWEEFQPEGAFEQKMVELMAKSLWRIRRATRYENGSVNNAAGWGGLPPENFEFVTPFKRERYFVAQAQHQLKTTGTISRGVYAEVLPHLQVELQDMKREEESKRPTEANIDPEFLAVLERRSHRLDATFDCHSWIEDLREEHYRAGNCLPPAADMDKIIRCEKEAGKQFDWALRHLLESQRRRREGRNRLRNIPRISNEVASKTWTR
jgi:hypothetical protein